MAKKIVHIEKDRLKRIAEISADLLDFDSSISEITTVMLASGVTPDVKTMLCVFQEKRTKPEPLEQLQLPPLMLPANLAQNPMMAAQYLRQVVESDKNALADGKIPDVVEQLHHCHLEIDEKAAYKMLGVLRDYYQEQKVSLQKELNTLLKPAKNGV